MSQTALAFAADHRRENLEHLSDFLRIPSVSTQAMHRPDIDRAAAWLVSRLQEAGLEHAQAMPTAGHPIVYAEWTGHGEKAPTLLIYGHYDVQPTDPEEEWLSPPFEPTIRAGNVYARGASDDKGQLYTHIAAVEAFFRAGRQPPVNVKFIVEGEEEIGSPNLGFFIQQQAKRLACDTALISDTAMLNADTPAIIYGVRGLSYAEIEIRGPKSDLHSGSYGGVAPNPLQAAVEILAALHDEQGRVTIPGFYDKVRPLSEKERDSLARVPFDAQRFLREEIRAPALWSGEAGYTPLERISARPTLEIHGIAGGYTGEGGKTVIPARATIKLSMRLVPDQAPLEVFELLEQYVQQLAPPTVKVVTRLLSHADAAVIDQDTPAMRAAVRAYRNGFGAEPLFLRSGGTLPVVTILYKNLHTPVVLMGFGLPDDNLHAPNEKLYLENFYRGVDTSIYFMDELAQMP
ncbi:MAG: dipeptidase [Anaerolineae bacterium]|nr:dipeptidase [Anaerolineae bacterium]